ncbi:Zinc finger BED domain-containing protein RICESLEEPER 2 [Rhynchospora pubera]|uniref:Zinc finger BED domain-containing protein RICESLEEPER 2 n=1 Tax=Rhynchospora pubera TaxID=906938 RepID=A0AAV8FY81_9POAL|nr:Zinc finger BED domain-containing protein RICESLEEPER 2 [Rhynchospora pubera]
MSTPTEGEDAGVNASIAIEDSQSVQMEEEVDTVHMEDIQDPGVSKGGRKRMSKVWNHFVAIEVQDKGKLVPKVECKHCKKRYKYVDGGPTSTLLLHVESKCAALQKKQGKTQGMINFESQESANFEMGSGPTVGYDHAKNREIMAKMIIAHELPFAFVEEGVKYLRKSPAKLFQFGEVAIAHGIETKRSLCSDVPTRWNSTHRMLKSALHYKTTIHHYAKKDPNYEWEPSDEEWASARKEICEAYRSDDPFLVEMSKPMFQKFEKYWGEVGVLMAVASIFDPRFKLATLKYTFKELYPANEVADRIKEVVNHLRALHEKYSKELVNSKAATSASRMEDASTSTEPCSSAMSKIFDFMKEMNGENMSKSDLEVYLEEPPYVHEGGHPFDLLLWWYQNCSKFPILSKLAKDVLCIPVTTVASESAFSAGGRVLDDYRSSLSKDMVELLVCGGDWLRAISKSTQVAKEEENLELQVAMKNLSMG